jgi:maltose alpha-D-glucosyltransferase/alpha-amylase
VDYADGDGETYLLPLVMLEGEKAGRIMKDLPHSVIARLRDKDDGGEAILCDAVVDKECCEGLLEMVTRGRHTKAAEGELAGVTTRAFHRDLKESLEPTLMKAEQTNTSVVFGRQYILKLVRRLEEGTNPDLEIGRFLTERGCAFIPPVAGAIEYRKRKGEPVTLAILQGFIPNQGDAWSYTLDVLKHYFERVAVERAAVQALPLPGAAVPESSEEEIPASVYQVMGPYLESARILGQRTGNLHLLLASERENPRFTPETFSTLYQRALYQSMRTLAARVFLLLRRRINAVPEALAPEARQVLGLEKAVIDRFRGVTQRKITAQRIRCHGDFHLGQVLYTGKDFVIIDFEGEPARPISERRIKRSPLRDVAGMLRSFHYAVYSALFDQETHGIVKPEDLPYLDSCANLWHGWVSKVYVTAYLEAASRAEFLPKTKEETAMLLDLYLLEKGVYELGYELNNRPDWLRIPVRGILQLLRE